MSSTSSEGSFEIGGTANFGTSCFGSGNIVAGTFPDGSFMIGTSVVLAIQTDNGTITFVGTDTRHGGLGEISGGGTQSPAARAIKLAQHCYMMTRGAIEPGNTPTSLRGDLDASVVGR